MRAIRRIDAKFPLGRQLEILNNVQAIALHLHYAH